jgi:hypothetical protein
MDEPTRNLSEARGLAAAVIQGDLAILEAAPLLSSALFGTSLQYTRLHNFFTGVASETDDLPIGRVRVHWAPEALIEKDQQSAKYESRIHDRFLSVCRELLAYAPERDSK